MTSEAVRASLARAARKAWPSVAKASDLPFPDYWRSVVEWLTFHAPRLGGRVTALFIEGAVVDAVTALKKGTEPTLWIVPERVKKIWSEPGEERAQRPATPNGGALNEGALNGESPAAQIRREIGKPMKQGRLL